jgi:NitT/TauT family transport system permease protein
MSATSREPTGAAPRAGRLLDVAVLAALAVALWQGLFAIAGDVALTPPLATVEYAAALVRTPVFWGHLAASGLALLYSLLIGALAGVALGLALGFHRFSGDVAEPILAALYTIPKVTLYPLVLLVFGLGISAKVAFGVMHGVIPVILFTMSAVKAINPVHLKTARVLKLTPWQTATTILAPAVTPEIITGLRVGFSLTLLGVIIGEMFASQRGLGFMIMNGMNTHDVRTTTAVILLLILFAIATNSALLALDRRLHRRG